MISEKKNILQTEFEGKKFLQGNIPGEKKNSFTEKNISLMVNNVGKKILYVREKN